jgi:hypothetical protein
MFMERDEEESGRAGGNFSDLGFEVWRFEI